MYFNRGIYAPPQIHLKYGALTAIPNGSFTLFGFKSTSKQDHWWKACVFVTANKNFKGFIILFISRNRGSYCISLFYLRLFALSQIMSITPFQTEILCVLCISQFQARTSHPRADPWGIFLRWSKALHRGKIFLQKHDPRGKKQLPPGSILEDLVSFSC